MTPEERAKGIATLFQGYGHPANLYRREIALIAAEIREAEEDARLDESKKCYAHKRKYQAEAYEDAAKIVANTPGNTYTTDCDHDALAEDIRARACT